MEKNEKRILTGNNYQEVVEKAEDYKIYDYYNDEIYKEYIIKYAKNENIKDLNEIEWNNLINMIRTTFCVAEYYNVKTHIEIGGGLDTGYKSLSIDDLKSEIEDIISDFYYDKNYRENTKDSNGITNNIINENQNINYVKKLKKISR